MKIYKLIRSTKSLLTSGEVMELGAWESLEFTERVRDDLQSGQFHLEKEGRFIILEEEVEDE